MTGAALVRELLVGSTCTFDALVKRIENDQLLSQLLFQVAGRLEGILREISPIEFASYIERNQWILDVVARNGGGLHWHELAGRLPAPFHHEIDGEQSLVDTVRLFVWLYHARIYDELEIVFEKKLPAQTGKTDPHLILRRKPRQRREKSSFPPPGTMKPSSPSTRDVSRSPRSRKYRHEDRSLDVYLAEMGETPLLIPSQEVSLAKRIQQGDAVSLEEMVKANLRFVVSIAKQYQNQVLSLADLIQEGNIGLIKAAKRFDETRGFKFISYAVWWIRQAILQALAEQSRIVRIPLNRVGTLRKVRKVSTLLEQELGRKPTDEEIAAFMADTSVSEVEFVEKISSTHLSLDAPFSTAEDNTLLDVLEDEDTPPPDNALFKEELKALIYEAIDSLTPREAEVINLYFGITEKALTLEEIGVRFHLTRERIRQIKEKALGRLRHVSRSRSLAAYKDDD